MAQRSVKELGGKCGKSIGVDYGLLGSVCVCVSSMRLSQDLGQWQGIVVPSQTQSCAERP